MINLKYKLQHGIKKFELLYSVSDIQGYFVFIFKNTEKKLLILHKEHM